MARHGNSHARTPGLVAAAVAILGVVVVSAIARPSAAPSAPSAATPDQAAAPKTFLITGSSSGFGRATAELLASKGYVVYAGARKQEDLDALNRITNVKAIRLDVTSQADIDAAVSRITADGRGLDGLVNNAGVAILFPLTEVDEVDLKYLFDVNIWGPYRVTKAFAPLLIRSKGRIVNVSSISGIFAAPLLGPYSMSKHAVEAFSDALRGEMSQYGVSVTAIEPGNFATEVGQTAYERMKERGQSYKGSPFEKAAEANMERLRLPDGKEGPERVASAIVEALTSQAPKPRALVVSNQRDAEVTIRSTLKKLAQINQGQPFAYDRDALVKMLDEALTEAGAAAAPSAAAGKVTGSVGYRERIALPPTAVVKVQLVDVSRADAKAIVIGAQTFETGSRQSPYAFDISYDPAKIEASHTYAVQARIEVGGKLRFISDQTYAVITRGAPSNVDIVLKGVGAPMAR